MKARIEDEDALRAISPSALAAYARGEGWIRAEEFGGHADVYTAPDRPELVLPRTSQLGDYPTVVSRVIEIMARSSGRDELKIYREIVVADRDVLRVSATGTDSDGSIPVDAGVKLVSQARDMLLAAACATRVPQPIYRAGANREAIEYMRRVKLGQTEHGSYTVTLLAPVPPELQPRLDAVWTEYTDEPLERQVTRRLMEALSAARDASENVLRGKGDAFERAVVAGVSANLCEAVAGLVEEAGTLDVSMAWARTRPTPENGRRVSFLREHVEILTEAARMFRSREPRFDETLVGTVHKLKRDQAEADGLVTFKAMIDNRLQSVRATLDDQNYSTAVRAHDERAPVLVQGDLVRVGQRWQLKSAKVVEVQSDAETDEQE
jgi:hypothetical protein